jgi:hypothetical protein
MVGSQPGNRGGNPSVSGYCIGSRALRGPAFPGRYFEAEIVQTKTPHFSMKWGFFVGIVRKNVLRDGRKLWHFRAEVL